MSDKLEFQLFERLFLYSTFFWLGFSDFLGHLMLHFWEKITFGTKSVNIYIYQ